MLWWLEYAGCSFFFATAIESAPASFMFSDKSPGPPLGFDGQEFQFCWSEQTRPRDYLGLTNDCLLVATHDNYCELYVLTSKTVELRRCQDMRCISRTAPIDHVRPGGDLGRLPRLPASRLKEHQVHVRFCKIVVLYIGEFGHIARNRGKSGAMQGSGGNPSKV